MTDPTARIAALEREVTVRTEQVRTLTAERDRLKATVDRLTAEAAAPGPAATAPLALDEVSKAFANLITVSHTEAAQPSPTGTAAILRSVEIEMKGFVDVQGGKPHVVLPKVGEAVEINALSLVKLSYVTVPTPSTGSTP